MPDVAERIRKILVKHLDVRPERLSDDARFVEDLGADSLDTIGVVMAIEEEFDIAIDDDGVEGVKTVGELVAAVRSFVDQTAGEAAE